jgi:hypothetical protein
MSVGIRNVILEKIVDMIATDTRDWSDTEQEAIIYGIIVGWSNEAMLDLQRKFGWSEKNLRELRSLRRRLTE